MLITEMACSASPAHSALFPALYVHNIISSIQQLWEVGFTGMETEIQTSKYFLFRMSELGYACFYFRNHLSYESALSPTQTHRKSDSIFINKCWEPGTPS